jgi:hypothetical protein
MDPDTVQPVKPRPTWSFIALLYALLSLALVNAWLLLMGAGFFTHIIGSIPGAVFVVLAAHRPPIEHRSSVERQPAPPSGFLPLGASCALLFILGTVFAASVLNQSLTLLLLVVTGFTFVPWARLAFSRHHPAISCMITASGCGSVIAIGYRPADIIFLPAAAWTFMLCSCCALLLRAGQRMRDKQDKKACNAAVKTGPTTVPAP